MAEREKARSPRAEIKKSAQPTGWRRLTVPYDPLTSLVLTMPVFLVYHLGLLLTDLRNGADLVTGLMVQVLDRSLLGYVALTLSVAVGVALAGRHLRKRDHHALEPKALVPVIAESTVWSFVMLVSVGWLTAQIVGVWLSMDHAPLLQLGPRTLGPLERIVMSAGAGFHEELVFRVGLFGGGALALERLAKLSTTRAALIAALVSSLLFSAVHYVGALGDGFTIASFLFRFFMGLAFAALYRFRGLAVAVYTHTIYDLLVFFVFGNT
ncbi:MAG: CPBP family intramembrane metalloprotease [Deltaproteobacteria bacterium]|nr:CPBP family intramembrane metalloprotease [Deltaproteobacteria bacterium]